MDVMDISALDTAGAELSTVFIALMARVGRDSEGESP